MSVERYITEIPLTFDVGDDLVIHRKIKYETYAANPADAETTARMFVTDFAKKLGENTSNYVNRQFYDWKSVPTIDAPIKVIKTHQHHDYLDGEEDLPLVCKDD